MKMNNMEWDDVEGGLTGQHRFPSISLEEALQAFQTVVATAVPQAIWIRAEINKLNFYAQSGHAYPELVEKRGGKTVAQMRCNLWREDFKRIQLKFKQEAKESLRDGIKVLLLAKFSFDPVYGLSLRILDIEPTFTLGDLEREKQQCILHLKSEGLWNSNRSLQLSPLPKRIAIISDQTSKGYADFIHVVKSHPRDFGLFMMLFPSALQGEAAIAGMKVQLRRIRQVAHHFDAVAIIRGGGGDVGLSCYNHLSLCKEIADFPLPVLTGIGHSTNETVAEMIAHTNAITPTKLAEILLALFDQAEAATAELKKNLATASSNILDHARIQFTDASVRMKNNTMHWLQQHQQRLTLLKHQLGHQVPTLLQEHRSTLQLLGLQTKQSSWLTLDRMKQLLAFKSQTLHLLHPDRVLERGYSLTKRNGTVLTSLENTAPGDILETTLVSGRILSQVLSVERKDEVPIEKNPKL